MTHMKIYLAGPMRGVPYFNFPAFDEAAAKLRAEGHEVFSPADHDRKIHGGDKFLNATGDDEQAEREHGVSRRKLLGDDLAWICAEADAIALLPGWRNSTGATAEHATAIAIGLKVIEL